MATEQEIIDFITLTHTYLTASDMAEELGEPTYLITKHCTKLGIKPINIKQQNINFILEHYEKMSGAKIARALGMSEESLLKNYGRELKIRFIKEEEVKEEEIKVVEPVKAVPGKSPRAILSEFRIHDAGHYNIGKADPKEVREVIHSLLKSGGK